MVNRWPWHGRGRGTTGKKRTQNRQGKAWNWRIRVGSGNVHLDLTFFIVLYLRESVGVGAWLILAYLCRNKAERTIDSQITGILILPSPILFLVSESRIHNFTFTFGGKTKRETLFCVTHNSWCWAYQQIVCTLFPTRVRVNQTIRQSKYNLKVISRVPMQMRIILNI